MMMMTAQVALHPTSHRTQVKMGVFDAVFTRMGAEDFIAQGRSTFMVELQEASDILHRATSRSLVLFPPLSRFLSPSCHPLIYIFIYMSIYIHMHVSIQI